MPPGRRQVSGSVYPQARPDPGCAGVNCVIMSKRIVLTGGGSAGHVTPNLALVPGLRKAGLETHYVGTEGGIERQLVERTMPFHVIEAGKLRRYLSMENISDVFRTVRGLREAREVLEDISPDLVFAKGGYVSVPVVFAAAKMHIPVILHESDYTPGLANRMCARKASRICLTFAPERQLTEKEILTGSPVREQLLHGDRRRGLAAAGFSGEKPVLLIMGGSLGAEAVNEAVDAALPEMLERFDIIHLRGRGHLNPALDKTPGYRQFEYIGEELPDFYKAANLALSRAGANAVFEFAALRLPALLVPLPLSASRGDQILNAGYFEKHGFAKVLDQENLNRQTLIQGLDDLSQNADEMRANMVAAKSLNGTRNVLRIILEEIGEMGHL